MDSEQATAQGLSMTAQWVLDAGIQPAFANQMLVQWGPPVGDAQVPDGAYLTFGHVNPPVFALPAGQVPTAEDAQGMVLPVMPVARLFVTTERLVEMVGTLQAQIEAVTTHNQP